MRLQSQSSFNQSQEQILGACNQSFSQFFCGGDDSSLYDICRSFTTTGLEVASLATAGYGLAKGGLKLASKGSRALAASTVESTGKFIVQDIGSLTKEGLKLDLDALSRAGQVMDRGGLICG